MGARLRTPVGRRGRLAPVPLGKTASGFEPPRGLNGNCKSNKRLFKDATGLHKVREPREDDAVRIMFFPRTKGLTRKRSFLQITDKATFRSTSQALMK